MAAMDALLDEGYPVFLTGDFNEPSSLDYTEEAVGTRKEITEPVAWPVSETLFDLGFRDTYREIHPDPVADPAITQERTGERIDYVYAAGPSKTLDSKLVGEPGGEDVDIEESPWTSDHRAVLSTFDVTPGGDADAGRRRRPPRHRRRRDHRHLERRPARRQRDRDRARGRRPRRRARDPLGARTSGARCELDTAGWDPASYEAVLLDGDGGEVARVPFYLRDPGAELELTTDKPTYERGEPIEVSWTAGPRQSLGLARRLRGLGRPTRRSGDYLTWDYAEGHSAGTVPPRTVGEATLGPESQGRLVAAPARRLRRPLPARRPVRVGRQRRVQRRRRLARAGAAASRAARRRPSPAPSAAASSSSPFGAGMLSEVVTERCPLARRRRPLHVAGEVAGVAVDGAAARSRSGTAPGRPSSCPGRAGSTIPGTNFICCALLGGAEELLTEVGADERREVASASRRSRPTPRRRSG